MDRSGSNGKRSLNESELVTESRLRREDSQVNALFLLSEFYEIFIIVLFDPLHILFGLLLVTDCYLCLSPD